MNRDTADRELRTYAVRDLRVESRAEGQGPRIVGHASVFNQWSEDLGGFRERIMPGAFSGVIRRDDVPALFNHDVNYVLGRNTAGTLALSEDTVGLKTVIDLPDSTFASDLAKSMKRGDIRHMSFAFAVSAEDQEWQQVDGSYRRTVHRVSKLWDVSVVTAAAYPQTDAALRALAAVKSNREGLSQDDRRRERTAASLQRSDARAAADRETRLKYFAMLIENPDLLDADTFHRAGKMLDLNDPADMVIYRTLARARLMDLTEPRR